MMDDEMPKDPKCDEVEKSSEPTDLLARIQELEKKWSAYDSAFAATCQSSTEQASAAEIDPHTRERQRLLALADRNLKPGALKSCDRCHNPLNNRETDICSDRACQNRSRWMPDPSDPKMCRFCGKSREVAKKMVAAPDQTTMICDECVRMSWELVNDLVPVADAESKVDGKTAVDPLPAVVMANDAIQDAMQIARVVTGPETTGIVDAVQRMSDMLQQLRDSLDQAQQEAAREKERADKVFTERDIAIRNWHLEVQAVKAQMVNECKARDEKTSTLEIEQRKVFDAIGKAIAPNENVTPCTVDAAVEDVQELAARLRNITSFEEKARRDLTAADSQIVNLQAVLAEVAAQFFTAQARLRGLQGEHAQCLPVLDAADKWCADHDSTTCESDFRLFTAMQRYRERPTPTCLACANPGPVCNTCSPSAKTNFAPRTGEPTVVSATVDVPPQDPGVQALVLGEEHTAQSQTGTAEDRLARIERALAVMTACITKASSNSPMVMAAFNDKPLRIKFLRNIKDNTVTLLIQPVDDGHNTLAEVIPLNTKPVGDGDGRS